MSQVVAKRGVAILLVDVINAFDFDGSERLVREAKIVANAIHTLASRARAAGVPVIYANDNFGQWRSDFGTTVSACGAARSAGRTVVARLRPQDNDYFVLKPQHSAFYATPLECLLNHLETRTLIIVGFAANLCVLFTANDAHMRGYRLVVPRDCTAPNTPALTRAALHHVRVALHGDTPSARSVDFAGLARRAKRARGKALVR